MMTQAFYTGISGIKSNQSAIDLVSDNMANLSTIGFRGSEYEFSSIFEESLASTSSAGDNTVGLGSQLQATAIKTTQGSLQLSDRSTDLAILGNGWFGIEGEGEAVYTRDGTFNFDANGDLVSLDGFHILGTLGHNIEDGFLTEKIDEVKLGDAENQEKLRFPTSLAYPAEPTDNVEYIGNIGATDELRTLGAGVIDPENNKNNLKLTFTLADTQVLPGSQWDIVATTQTLDGETIYDTKTGSAEFDAGGALVSHTLTTIDNNGAEITIDLGEGYSGVVSIANSDITASSIANGTEGGDLAGYTINKNAEVIATFTNGEQSSVGKIAIYHFQNEQGLGRLNGSKFEKTSNSGEPIFYQNEAGENIIGADVINFKLESSNIDISYGLTELIILQRSYDANSKSISTADQMMQKALSMDA